MKQVCDFMIVKIMKGCCREEGFFTAAFVFGYEEGSNLYEGNFAALLTGKDVLFP